MSIPTFVRRANFRSIYATVTRLHPGSIVSTRGDDHGDHQWHPDADTVMACDRAQIKRLGPFLVRVLRLQ